MIRSRRIHQKSRTGCLTCKQKKVKCDELQPTCQYCADRSLQCTYPSPRSTLTNRRSKTPVGQTTTSGLVTTNEQLAAPSAVLTYSTSILSPPVQSPRSTAAGQWNLADLELLHFYTASTSLTLSKAPERQHVWQYVVPQIAFSHEFLLHALLALSALHLSRISPERQDILRTSAFTHHATSLPMFRAAVESISSVNCHACSAFGTILAVYEWAASNHTSDLFFTDVGSLPEANTIEWVQLVRGSGNIVYHHYAELMNGPMQTVLRWDIAAEQEAELCPAESAKFSALEQLWNAPGRLVSPTEVESLNEACRWLKIIYTIISTPHNNSDPASAALSWPVRVPELFLMMVNQRQPAALILLAHFCLLLNKIEDVWWIRGMSRKLLRKVTKALGEEWQTWVGWPLQDLILSEFRDQILGENP